MSISSKKPIVHQPSQEEVLEIMKKVKLKEITIEEAIGLTKGSPSPIKEATRPQNMASLDPPPAQQYNFSVYKFRYRWQKRILQIDFNTKTIYNIEKGTLRRQFPFSRIKSCESSNGLKFLIMFHGHQDYELEADSTDDKESIIRILNSIVQNNRSSPTSPVKVRRPSHVEVIHEGLLDLQDQGSDSWVKYLVKLNMDELVLYPTERNQEPIERTINLSDYSVSADVLNGYPVMSLQTLENSYVFRIPLNEQTRNSVNSLNIRDEWVALLQKYCAQHSSSVESPVNGSLYSTVNHQTAQPSEVKDSHVYCKIKEGENGFQIYNDPDPVMNPMIPKPAQLTPSQVLIPTRPVPPPPPTPPPSLVAVPNLPKRTKPFHWDTVSQEKINKSMWAPNSSVQKKIDAARILHQFQIQETPNATDNSLKNQNILLDKKIAHNFSIVLKSFHMQPSELQEKLLVIKESDGGLTDEQLTNLRRYMPTEKDQKMYLSYKGSPSELHEVDQFMLEMCKIPDLGPRVDVLLAIRELPMCMKDMQPLVHQTTKACRQLLASQGFVAVLQYILAMGNYLNLNAGKGKAQGVRLISLTKMSQLTMSRARRLTLLHALVEQIILQEPDLTKFPQELTEFEAVPGASVKGLSAEVDVLVKELDKISQYKTFFKGKYSKATGSRGQFLKHLKDVLELYNKQYTELSKETGEMKKLYSQVLQKFGEPEDQDSQELFGWISTFIKEFQMAHRDVRNP
ncbi:disheveled-associated activator of morphogenesis 2-like [Discoglossus pictus]